MSMNPGNFRPKASADHGQQYLDATIRTATPAKLRLMLLERAVEISRMVAENWQSGKVTGSHEHSITLMEMIAELLTGVAGGSNKTENKLCLQVSDLYVFLLKHLVAAEETSDVQSANEITTVLQAETETWRAVVAQEGTGQFTEHSALAASANATAGSVPAPKSPGGSVATPSSGGFNFTA